MKGKKGWNISTETYESLQRNTGSEFGVLSWQCPRHDFHNIGFHIKMKTAIICMAGGICEGEFT